VFTARTAAIEHLARGDVMNRAAEIPAGVGVEIGERRILLPALVVGQRIIHDGVLRHFGQRDVLAHVVQIRAVVLAHDEKLARVAEHCGADARLFEPGVLLNDADVPAIKLAKLRVGLLDDFLAAGNVEETGDFFIDVPFPQRSRQRDDMLAGVIGDEEKTNADLANHWKGMHLPLSRQC
jgi:hypothetical protein